MTAIGDFNDPTHSDPAVKGWNHTFRNKPVAVGCSGGIAGGVRAIEHRAQIAIEAELVPLRAVVIIRQVSEAFDGSDLPINPVTDIGLGIALDDLVWWSAAPERAWAGELAPAAFRIQAAATVVNEIDDEVV